MHFVLRALLVVAVLTPAVARAQSADDEARARARYLSGRQLYEVGRYDEAIRDFSAGYDLSKKPRFLYNLALCYRKLGDLPRTRDYLRRFLSAAPANDPNRHSIEGQLADVEAQLALQSGKPPPPVATTPPPAAPATPAAPSAAPAPAASAQPTSGALVATAPPHKSAKRHLAWIIPLSAVVAGVAIGLGVYFGTQGCQASVGCLDAGR